MKNHQQNNGWIDNRTVLQININGKNNNIILCLIKNNLLIDSRSIEVDVKLLLLSRSVFGDPWRMHRLRDTGGSLLLCLWRSWLWLFEITWTERENTAVFLLLLFFGLGTRLMPISKEKNKSQRRNKTNFSLFVVLPSSSFFLFYHFKETRKYTINCITHIHRQQCRTSGFLTSTRTRRTQTLSRIQSIEGS